jgi:SfnB family sulfur acquisition oxidoreductase
VNEARRLASDAEAIAAAREFAAAVAPSAEARHRAGGFPAVELRRFAATGLLGAIVPRDLGGAAISAVTLGEVLAIVAAADGSLAQAPQPHYVTLLAALLAGDPQQRSFFASEALRGARFGNALSERGTRTSMAMATRLTRDGAGFRLNGRKYYCTGSEDADWVPTYALDEAGRMVLAFVERGAAGLTLLDDWDAIGQRGTGSGTAVLADARVPAEHVVALWRLLERPQVWNAFARFLHAAIDLGLADGPLQAGRVFLRERARPWVEAGVERASEEPHVLLRYGQLVTERDAGQVLLRRAGRLLDRALADADAARVAEASSAVSEVKGFTAELAVAAATEIFGFAGTSAADEAAGLARRWRDARTHSIHDPVRWSFHAAGYYAIHGVFPRSGAHGGAAGHAGASP